MTGNDKGNGYTFTPVCRAGQGTIYEQFHVGVPGDGPIHENATGFQGLSQKYGEMQTAFQKALGGIKTTYTGSAADSMQSAFEPLVKGMGDGQTMTQQASTALTNQAGQFTATQSKINNTVAVPDEPWYGGFVPWNTDHDDAVDKNNGINNANAAAYSAYGSSTTSNVQTFPGFTDHDTMNPDSIGLGSKPVGPVGHSGDPGGVNGGGGGYSPHNVGGGGSGGGGAYQPGSTGGGQYNPAAIGADGNGQYVPPSGSSSTNLQSAGGGGGYPPGGGSWSYPAGGDGSGGGGMGGGFPMGGGFGGGGGGGGSSYGGSGGGSYGSAKGAMGSGATAGAGAKPGTGAGAGAKPGAGAAAGMGAGEEGGRMGGAAAGARGAAGANSGMMGGGQGRGGKKEEDGEHKSAAYLVSEEDEIVGDLPATLPPGGVIGG